MLLGFRLRVHARGFENRRLASGETSISKDDFVVPPTVGQPKALFCNALRGFIFVCDRLAATLYVRRTEPHPGSALAVSTMEME